MTERSAYAEDDPRHHTAHLRELPQAVVDHARQDIGKISEPKAQALALGRRDSLVICFTARQRLTRMTRPGGPHVTSR